MLLAVVCPTLAQGTRPDPRGLVHFICWADRIHTLRRLVCRAFNVSATVRLVCSEFLRESSLAVRTGAGDFDDACLDVLDSTWSVVQAGVVDPTVACTLAL